MREFKVIDSAESADKLRLRLKESELEQFGDSFIPEYVYDAIRRHAQFSNMRVSVAVTSSLLLTAVARPSTRCRGILGILVGGVA
jgi:hypothetical protein